MRKNDLCSSPRHCNDGHPYEHADDCPVSLLQASMTGTSTGRLLEQALTIDFALEKGFQTSLDDIPADEFTVLRILQDEQNKYEREQTDKSNQQARPARRS